MENIADIQIHYHKTAIRALEQRLKEFRENCNHMWEREEGYVFKGFYCRKCGSTKVGE